MSRWKMALVIIAALAACTDREPVGPTRMAPNAPRHYATTQPAQWRGYWRNNNALWIYDMTQEVGMTTHTGADPDFADMRSAGIRMARYTVLWNKYAAAEASGCTTIMWDGKRGGCYSEGLRNAVYWAQQRGIELVVTVLELECSTAEPCDQSTPPSDGYAGPTWNQHYANFLALLAGRYPSVHFWQLWNEPDAGYWGVGPFGTIGEACNGNHAAMGARYADMLKVAYPAIKQANPNAWVLTAGLTGNEGWEYDPTGMGTYCNVSTTIAANTLSWAFLRGMYANGAKGYFDILAVHGYGQNPRAPAALGPKLNALNWEINQTGSNAPNDANRPIWVTEFGTNAASSTSNGSLLDPADRANWRTQFDNQQMAWYQDALQVQSEVGVAQKMIGAHMQSPEGGAIHATDAAHSFLDADAGNYGLGIIREDAARTRRPAFNWLVSRAATNMAAENIDAGGGQAAIFRIGVWGTVPADQPFHYDDALPATTLILDNVNVRTLVPTVVGFITPITYSAHASGIGWMSAVYNDQVAGTTGQSRQMEALRVNNVGLPYPMSICYQANVNTRGWMTETCNGGTAGTTGLNLRMEQVKIRLANQLLPSDVTVPRWHVCYSAHGPYGWSAQACDGSPAGVAGTRMEALKIRLYKY